MKDVFDHATLQKCSVCSYTCTEGCMERTIYIWRIHNFHTTCHFCVVWCNVHVLCRKYVFLTSYTHVHTPPLYMCRRRSCTFSKNDCVHMQPNSEYCMHSAQTSHQLQNFVFYSTNVHRLEPHSKQLSFSFPTWIETNDAYMYASWAPIRIYMGVQY